MKMGYFSIYLGLLSHAYSHQQNDSKHGSLRISSHFSLIVNVDCRHSFQALIFSFQFIVLCQILLFSISGYFKGKLEEGVLVINLSLLVLILTQQRYYLYQCDFLFSFVVQGLSLQLLLAFMDYLGSNWIFAQ